jgi:hypothetical protein
MSLNGISGFRGGLFSVMTGKDAQIRRTVVDSEYIGAPPVDARDC